MVAQLEKRMDDYTIDATARRIAERRVDPYSEVEELAKKLGL